MAAVCDERTAVRERGGESRCVPAAGFHPFAGTIQSRIVNVPTSSQRSQSRSDGIHRALATRPASGLRGVSSLHDWGA